MGNRKGIIYDRKKTGEKKQYQGMNIKRALASVAIKSRTEKESNKELRTDGDFRKYIINLIIENIQAGKSEEEALQIALNDEISKKFEYLEKQGLDIKQCFRNWERGYAKSRNIDIYNKNDGFDR